MSYPATGATTLTTPAVLGRLSVAGRERTVSRARAFVGDVLGASHPQTDVASLLVSELVTNAIRHSRSRRAGGTVRVVILQVRDGIRVEVTDDGSASVPVIRHDAPLAEDGRGLLLVDALAHDWGWMSGATATTVWFSLSG